MISQIFWLVPNQVLYWKMSGRIPGIEICEMSRFIAIQVDRSTFEKVHIVIDSSGVKQLAYANREARAAFYDLANEPCMGKVVAITHNLLIRIHLNALSAAFGLNWHNVTSMQDAIRFLKQSDNLLQTVPNLPSNPSLYVLPELQRKRSMI